jgi:cytochrome P450
MSQYVTHHDPRYYPEPFHFDPMRWTAEAHTTRPKYAYFPFRADPRQCLGQSFAWMEVPKYSVELAAQTSLQPKHGLLMRLEEREIV